MIIVPSNFKPDNSMNTIAKNIKVIPWNKHYETQALEFLKRHEETSLLVLENLKTFGPTLTEDSYSGNFKCLIDDEQVVAVFALTRAGNLIVQTDRNEDYAEIIVNACLQEAITFHGVVGDWELAKSIWDCARQKIPTLKENPCKKAILYNVNLEGIEPNHSEHEIKYLTPPDYAAWNKLYQALQLEQHLDHDEAEKIRQRRFMHETARQYWLGLFIYNQLVSIVAYIACTNQTGQVGGVYTLPAMRRKGLVKTLMLQLMYDAKVKRNLDRMVLCTGEDNFRARQLYEGLGFKKIGYFGLLFG